MAESFEFARWATRFRAFLLIALVATLGACDATDEITSVSEETTETLGSASEVDVAFASNFRGGIPMGNFAQPTKTLGSRYNGTLRVIWPKYLRSELAAIKARGGRVILSMTGSEHHMKDRRGHFDFGKWKARVDRYKGIDFDSYIRDGTLIGHYIVDEPNDKSNWRGKAVSPALVEEMAKYSKRLWPNLPTIARAEPGYFGHNHRYLDAAWAQYVTRKGTASDYIRRNVADAQRRGLALVVGLNIRKGGPRGRSMSAKEIESWGATMLSSTYPCAFISWQYTNSLSSRTMSRAMDQLRRKAQSRGTKSCRS